MVELTGTGISLFGVFLRWYGLIIACAVLTAVFLCMAREKRYGLPGEVSLDLALIVVPIGIICARLYYVLFNLDYYLVRPIEMLWIHKGGLAIYGGIIGGSLAVFVYSRIKRIPFLKLADLIAPALALAQAIGRWGNYFNQEAYGKAITDPALQFFPLAVRLDGGTWHYATFFYESVWCVAIAALLLIWEGTGRKHRKGDMFFSYLFLYAAERFLVEGLRMDSLMIGPVRVSQALSFAVLVIFSICLAVRSGNNGNVRKLFLFLSLILLACAEALLPIGYAALFALLMIAAAAALAAAVPAEEKT